jgi:hypothetical protein
MSSQLVVGQEERLKHHHEVDATASEIEVTERTPLSPATFGGEF